MLTSSLLRVWFRKAVTNALDFKSFNSPIEANEPLDRFKLEWMLCLIWTCVSSIAGPIGSGSLGETVRATLAQVPLDQVLWTLQVRVEKHKRGVRESTIYRKGKKKLQPLDIAPKYEINLPQPKKYFSSFICVPPYIAPWAAAVCGPEAALRLLLAPPSWGDSVHMPMTLGEQGLPPRDGVCISRWGKTCSSTELHVEQFSMSFAYFVLMYVAITCHFECTFWWQAIYQLTIELVIS